MPKATFLKHRLPRLAAVLLLCLFTVAGFAEESRPPWKIAIFRSNSPKSIEVGLNQSGALWAINRLQPPFQGACRSELAREQRRPAGDRFIREQARSYTGAGDWLRPIESASRVIR